jgi:membrane protein required for colicin V production
MAAIEGYSLNLMDIIAGGVIGFGMYRGYQKGIVKEGIGIFAVLLAAVWGVKFSYLADEFILKNFEINQEALPLISFATTFVIILIVLSFLIKFLDDLLSKVFLGGINKAFGALFGGFKLAFIMSFLLLLLSMVNIPSPNSVKDSVTYTHVKDFGLNTIRYVFKVLPFAKEKLQNVENYVKDNIGEPGDPDSEDPDSPGTPKPPTIR